MAKYIILIGTNKNHWFEEVFEEMSGRTIRERVDEIYSKGFEHISSTGNIMVKPEDIVTVRSDRQ